MHLFTTEDAEDTEVNLVHAGTEMNEMTCILGIFVQPQIRLQMKSILFFS